MTQLLSQETQFIPLVRTILQQVHSVVNCSQVTVFMFKQDGFNSNKLPVDMTVQRTVLDGKYVDVLGMLGQPLADPQFKKLKES